VRSIVIAPANTGRAKSNKIAVRKTDQTNRGVWSHVIPGLRMLMIVVIKLIAPKMEEAPARCRLKIDKSTEAPEWAKLEARGG
jgi:hypothetical protein